MPPAIPVSLLKLAFRQAFKRKKILPVNLIGLVLQQYFLPQFLHCNCVGQLDFACHGVEGMVWGGGTEKGRIRKGGTEKTGTWSISFILKVVKPVSNLSQKSTCLPVGWWWGHAVFPASVP